MIVAATVLSLFAPGASAANMAAATAAAASDAASMARLLSQREQGKEEAGKAEAANVVVTPSSTFPSRYASCPSHAHDPLGYEECASKMTGKTDKISKSDVVGLAALVAFFFALVWGAICSIKFFA